MEYFGKEGVNVMNRIKKILTCLIILAYMSITVACTNTNENNTSNSMNNTESYNPMLNNNGSFGTIVDEVNDSFPPNSHLIE